MRQMATMGRCGPQGSVLQKSPRCEAATPSNDGCPGPCKRPQARAKTSPASIAMDFVVTRMAFPPVDDADVRLRRVKEQ